MLDAPADARPELAQASASYWVIRGSHDRALEASRIGCTKSCTRRLAGLDLTRLDLSGEDEALARGRIVDGTAVVLAKLVSDGPGEGTLVVGNVWLRAASSPSLASSRTQTDQMYRLRDVGETCTYDTSCRWLRAEPLDGGRAISVANIELTLVGGSLEDDARAALAKGELLARGVGAFESFMVASVFVPFPPASSDLAPTRH